MNKETIFKPSILPVFTLLAGAAGFLLRLTLMRTQMDANGLLTANHPLLILLYLLSALTLGVLALCVLPLKSNSRRKRKLFPGSTIRAIGCGCAGVGSLIACLLQVMKRTDALTSLTMAMAFVAALCFLFLGYARQKGSRPHFLVHTGITVFLMLLLVSQYRLWSPEPQLALYFFQLMACIFLMLTAYQMLCLDIQKGDRRLYVFFCQAALYFCCVSLTDAIWPFYLGMGAFCATNLCSLRISQSHSREASPTPEEEPVLDILATQEALAVKEAMAAEAITDEE